jgi:hypothetical protein
MGSEIYATLASSLPTIIIAGSIFFLITLLPTINYKLKLAKLPTFGKGQFQHFYQFAFQTYKDGYHKVGRVSVTKISLC